MVDRLKTYRSFVVQYPPNNWYVENPTSSNVQIKNRTAGYFPPPQFVVTRKEVVKDCPMVYQTSADIITPKNLCYIRFKQFPVAP